MSYAFEGVLRSKWNEEVIEYLASKFNTINPRIIVISKAVFINATLAKFDNVSFIINASNEILELSFAKIDADKMEPIIQAIQEWDAFTKNTRRFCVKVDKDTSRSILFDTGDRQGPNSYKRHFCKYETEVVQINNKH